MSTLPRPPALSPLLINRWCNTASDSRPRPKMDTAGGVFGRVGVAIAQDNTDYERLDRHYQVQHYLSLCYTVGSSPVDLSILLLTLHVCPSVSLITYWKIACQYFWSS